MHHIAHVLGLAGGSCRRWGAARNELQSKVTVPHLEIHPLFDKINEDLRGP